MNVFTLAACVAVTILLVIVITLLSVDHVDVQSGNAIPVLAMNVVHMSSKPDRKKNFIEKFKPFSKLNIMFQEAITPRSDQHIKFSESQKTKLLKKGNQTRPSEIACALSHFDIAMNRGVVAHPTLSDWIIIAEDDLEPLKDLNPDYITSTMFSTLSSASENIKYIMFSKSTSELNFKNEYASENITKEVERVNKSIDENVDTYAYGIGNGMMCYAIRRSFAQKILFPAYTADSNELYPIDGFIRSFFGKNKNKHVPLMIIRYPFHTYYVGNGMFVTTGKFLSTLDEDRKQCAFKLWSEYFS